MRVSKLAVFGLFSSSFSHAGGSLRGTKSRSVEYQWDSAKCSKVYRLTSFDPNIDDWFTIHPLFQCTGTCNLDWDCLEGLVCFHRKPFEDVPGCAGGYLDGSKTNYCVNPNSTYTCPPLPTTPVDRSQYAPEQAPRVVFPIYPSDYPSLVPSDVPSYLPSNPPSLITSDSPSFTPSDPPSFVPSDPPSLVPSDSPSRFPLS